MAGRAAEAGLGLRLVLAPGRVIGGMHIRDTAPTLLYAARQAVPEWMEGSVRGDLMAEPWEPSWDREPEPDGGDTAGGSEGADAAAIEESLRGLGYLQ